MKKNILFSALLIVALASCKKKAPEKDPDTDPFKLEYSNLTTEQHKSILENNGVDFVKKLNTLPDEKFISAISHLAELDLELLSNNFSGRQIMATSLAAKNQNVNALFSAVAVVQTTIESNNLSEFYGVYTWNSTKGDWVKTESNTKFEVIYPASASSNTNNATLTITYAASTSKVLFEGEYYELPASVNASLKIDNKEELKLASVYEYKSNGTPAKTNVNLTLGSFSFKTEVSNDLSNVNANVSMSKGNEVLFSVTASGNGNGDYDDIVDTDNIEDVLKSANTSFEIMNIKIVGEVDVKAIALANKASEGLSEKQASEAEAAALNKHSKLVAIYKNENTVIAKAEFVSVEEVYSYEYPDWNTGLPVKYTYTYYSVEPRLVFKDGSKVSLDAYFESGFGKLINDVEAYLDRF